MPASARRRRNAVEAGIVALVLLVFVAAVAKTLDQPLLEIHAFRQTQTAYTARIYHQDGIDLLHPKLPVLGEPFEVPFEFPLFQAAASVVMDAGVRDDVAMRSTGLVCFLLTALLLYGLVRKVDGTVSAIAALVAFVATPFALVWGRTSMIEYLATAGAVGWAWATIAWRENGRPEVGVLALAAGLVGMLVKPTTAVFWIIPALAYRPVDPRPARRRRTVAALVVLVVVPLAAALLWTRHADEIKAASPTTSWLTSDALREWNFGTLHQRLELGVWGVIRNRLIDFVLGPEGLALLAAAVLALARSAQRLFWLGVALAAVLPLLTFTNLYLVHDYYLAAITPALAALIGLGVGFLWRLLPQRPGILAAAVLVGIVLAASTLVHGRAYARQAYNDHPDPGTRALAQQLDGLTRRDDRVAVVGLAWSPAVLYYADRWGLMVLEEDEEGALDELQRGGYPYLLAANSSENDLRALASWPWLASLSENVYGMARSAADLPPSELVATDDARGLSSGRLLRRGLRVRCSVPTRIPSGDRGTLVRLSNPKRTTRVSLSDELAFLPARRALLVAPRLGSGGTLTFNCLGQRSLTIDVSDAAFPPVS